MPIDQNSLDEIESHYNIVLPRKENEGELRVAYLSEILYAGGVAQQLNAGKAYVVLLQQEPETVSAESLAILFEAIKEGYETPSNQKWSSIHDDARAALRALGQTAQETGVTSSGVRINDSSSLPDLIFAGIMHEITYPGSLEIPGPGGSEMREAVKAYTELLRQADSRIATSNLNQVSTAIGAQRQLSGFMRETGQHKAWQAVQKTFNSAVSAFARGGGDMEQLRDIPRSYSEARMQHGYG